MITKYVHLMMRRLKPKSRQGPVDMELWYRYVVFDIICDLAVALAAVINPVLGLLAKGNIRLHNDMVKPLVEKRLQAGTRPDLINPLIKLYGGQDSNIDELIANATAIIGAGAETSASILTAVTSLLVDNPDKLVRLTDEVRSVFSSQDQITADAVSRLPYLVACIDEALRLFPQTGTPSLRLTDRETTIVGIPVLKNTVVGIWPWALYRAAALWTDPDGFHPERFLEDPKYANDARDAFKPFFTGSRDCIGQNLAVIEMRLILASMVSNFDMGRTADPHTKDWVHKQKNLFIVWSKSSLPVQLTPVL